MLSNYNINQSPSLPLNEDNQQCDQPSLIYEQQDHYSSVNKQINLPSEQHQNKTLLEHSNVDESYQQNLIHENQVNDNGQRDINTDSINQRLTTQPSLINDEQVMDENLLHAGAIQETEMSGPNNAVNFQIDNHSHYTTYFYEQLDFKDYADSKIVARVPKLFSGKRFIS
jgi:hypothetical protein